MRPPCAIGLAFCSIYPSTDVSQPSEPRVECEEPCPSDAMVAPIGGPLASSSRVGSSTSGGSRADSSKNHAEDRAMAPELAAVPLPPLLAYLRRLLCLLLEAFSGVVFQQKSGMMRGMDLASTPECSLEGKQPTAADEQLEPAVPDAGRTTTSKLALALRKPLALQPASSSESLQGPDTPPASVEPAAPGKGAKRMGSYAYVTLLTRDGYLPGVQALARSLAAVHSAHPLLVMLTADTLSQEAQAALQAEGCQLVPVERYLPAGHGDVSQYKLALYAECWCKLQMWTLEQYSRLIYLDADMVVTRNIDALFSLPAAFYAVPDCSHGRLTQAERDACPLLQPGRPHYFNAGFFVMTPSRAELYHFNHLLSTGAISIGGFAEQDFLNEYQRGSWRPLPLAFNAQKGAAQHHPELWAQAGMRGLAIIHYTDAKPWVKDHPDHQIPAFRPLVQLWWEAFEQQLSPGPPVSVEELLQALSAPSKGKPHHSGAHSGLVQSSFAS